MTTVIKTVWQAATETGDGDWKPLTCGCKFCLGTDNGRIYVTPCDHHATGNIDLPNIIDTIQVNKPVTVKPMDPWTIGQDSEHEPSFDDGS